MRLKLNIGTLIGHTDGITQIIELKNGDLLSSSRDTTIRLWKKV